MLTEQQKANVTKWVTALRSDDFKQGKAYLQKDGAYCCLGVAAEVMGVSSTSNPDGEVGHNYDFPNLDDNDYNEFQFSPPYQWFMDMFGSVDPASDMDSLTIANDECEVNFFSIADWIESKFFGIEDTSQFTQMHKALVRADSSNAVLGMGWGFNISTSVGVTWRDVDQSDIAPTE
jgi:hypothetical protein